MLKLTEVAARFGVQKDTIYKWIKSGDVFDSSNVKLTPGGHMRILESEVNSVILKSPSIEDCLS